MRQIDHFQQAVHHVFFILSRRNLPGARARNRMFSPTVSESKSAPDWNTIVTFLRMLAQFGFRHVL